MNFSANGKLLLTGEYLVMHGGLALALPVRFGQKMSVTPLEDSLIKWTSLDHKGNTWFEATLSSIDFSVLKGKGEIADRLSRLLSLCRVQKADFTTGGAEVICNLEFPLDWGLGSSSTLVSLLAQWSGADPFSLQFEVFGGSAYDIACATSKKPILYKLLDGKPVYEEFNFEPKFRNNIWFVHLGRKQDSRESIAAVNLDPQQSKAWLNTLVHLTVQLRFCERLVDFEEHMRKHEEVIGALIGKTPVKLERFSDYPGAVKSLGAWGGDFALVTHSGTAADVKTYFQSKGLETVLSWEEMIG